MFNEYAFGKEECKIAGTIPSIANEKFAFCISMPIPDYCFSLRKHLPSFPGKYLALLPKQDYSCATAHDLHMIPFYYQVLPCQPGNDISKERNANIHEIHITDMHLLTVLARCF